MIDITALEVKANRAAKRTRNTIPEGWWRNMFRRHEVTALLETGRWKLERVTGTIKFLGVRPATTSQVFLRRVSGNTR